MTDIVLHHYEGSPFSEKAKLMLGFKDLEYHSCIIPGIMPKPDLTELTGGYRKTPVLQVGSHIYCDSERIAMALEEIRPEPTLYPADTGLAAKTTADWADHTFFQIMIGYSFQPRALSGFQMDPDMAPKVARDRVAMRQNSNVLKFPLEESITRLNQLMERLEGHLAGHPFALGETACIADFSLYHNFWMMRRNSVLEKDFDHYPHIRGWMDRVAGFGYGRPVDISSGDAVKLAARTAPGTEPEDFTDPNGFRPGDEVQIRATDYGRDPVAGILVRSGTEEIALRRHGERAGDLIVHFPRNHYEILRPESK